MNSKFAKLINENLTEAIDVLNSFSSSKNEILLTDKIIKEGIKTLQNEGKIIFCGNGGSFADAQHISAEFVSRFKFDRPALASCSLGTNSSIISAISNDYGFERIFERELEAISKKHDLVILLTTSGNSKNILNAADFCNKSKLKVFCLTGSHEGEIVDKVQCMRVPSLSTARIQEMHIKIGHIICDCIEQELFSEYK